MEFFMKKNYVYKVNATGEIFHDLPSAVNAAALSLYARNRYGQHRISDPVAVKRQGGYAVHAFDLYGKCLTANIDVFVPATFTKKGKQIKVDGLNATNYNKYKEFVKCEWDTPAPAPDPVPVDLEVYDVDEDDYDEEDFDEDFDEEEEEEEDYDEDDIADCIYCEHCGVAIYDNEQAYETEDGETICKDCYTDYLDNLDAEDLEDDEEDEEGEDDDENEQ